MHEATNSSDTIDVFKKSRTSQEQLESKAQEHDYQLIRDREKRQIRPLKRYRYRDLITYTLIAAHIIDDEEPKTYKKTIQNKFREHRLRAMKYEMDILHKNET